MSSRFDTHLTPGLTRKICQIVLFHHDLVGSAWISQRCRTGRHRIHNVFQHLWSHWHLYLLSDFITHSNCRQGRNHRPFDKEQTLFLVQLCVCMFRLGHVWKEQCSNICTKITPVPLLSETAKKQNWFLNCRRLEKHSNLSTSGNSRTPSCCNLAPACLLMDDTGLSVTPMIHGSTLEMIESSPTTLGSCEGYDTVDAVSEGRNFSVSTTSTRLPLPCVFFSCFCPYFCWRNCHALHHRDSSSLPPYDQVFQFSRVDVCRARVGRAGRAITSLVLVFTFVLSLASLERVNLLPVIVRTRSTSR